MHRFVQTSQTSQHLGERMSPLKSTRLPAEIEAMKRALASEKEKPKTLRECRCLRCTYAWWPRQTKSPRRCARCKSPYWNRPRKKKPQVVTSTSQHSPSPIANDTRAAALAPSQAPEPSPDQSARQLFTVLKEMKGNNAPWAEILERVRQEFDVELTKEQVKTLVR